MELIYSRNGVEQGILRRFTADFEESTDVSSNTFELQIPIDQESVTIGDYVYEDGTELGGIIDSLKIDTSSSVITLDGRTWRGVLGSKILEPPTGSAYYSVSGDANAILSEIITKTSLEGLFSAETSEIMQISWQFDRYTDAYTGIIKMLSENGLKLVLTCNDGTVTLEAKEVTDYSDEADITSESFTFKLSKKNPTANHMIGLGSGELTERLVVHKYIQEDGTIGDTQYYTGAEEVVAVFDYPNCESSDELSSKTIEALQDCSVDDSLEISAYNLEASIGDKFLATDETTGISVTQYVTDKIITATESVTTKIQYKVGGTIL